MCRFFIQAALVVIMASPAVSHADNFKLTFPYCEPCAPSTVVTFYLPPNLTGPYGEGLVTVTNASYNGSEFQLTTYFLSPENTDGTDKALFLSGGGIFGPEFGCPSCVTWLVFDDFLINDLTPGDPFIAGTHTGSFSLEPPLPFGPPVTLVITPDASTVPEPSSLLLLATGFLGLGVGVYRKSHSLL
jgi:hypothetical protein